MGYSTYTSGAGGHGTIAWLAHQWAYHKRERGVTRHGSVMFEGQSIFSWGDHYELGRIVPELGVALINESTDDGGGSISTGNHRRYVSHAADKAGYKVLGVQAIPLDAQKEVDHWLGVAADNVAKAGRALRFAAIHSECAMRAVERALLFADYGGKVKTFTPDPKIMAKLVQRAVKDMVTTGDTRLRDAVRQLETLAEGT